MSPPVIQIKSGLVHVVRHVREDFKENDVTANVSLGWKERAKQVNQGPGGANRVVFTPCDDNGNGGVMVAPKFAGPREVYRSADGKVTWVALAPPPASMDPPPVLIGTVRALHDWQRIAIVSIWAVDRDDVDDEEKQIEATEALYESVLQATQTTQPVGVQWGAVNWTPVADRTFGREIRASITLTHPMFGRPTETVRATPQINRGPLHADSES